VIKLAASDVFDTIQPTTTCNTKSGSGGLPIFAFGEAMYRAASPEIAQLFVGKGLTALVGDDFWKDPTVTGPCSTLLQ
jgi:hypothetical protein